MSDLELNNVLNVNFTNQKAYAHSSIDRLIKQMVREVRHHKLTYEQLKRIFRVVRRQCDVEVPKKSVKLIELPTNEQLNTWLSVVQDPIHKLIFKTLIGTGLRVSELCNIEVKHIDFEKNQIFVKEGKGSKDRIVVIGHNLKSQLQLYLAGKNNRYLFESPLRRSKYSSRRIQQMFEIYSKKSGVHLHAHLCRHMFATSLAAAGMSEDHRKVLCGHSKNSDAQQIYTHLSLAGIKDRAIEVLDNLSF